MKVVQIEKGLMKTNHRNQQNVNHETTISCILQTIRHGEYPQIQINACRAMTIKLTLN